MGSDDACLERRGRGCGARGRPAAIEQRSLASSLPGLGRSRALDRRQRGHGHPLFVARLCGRAVLRRLWAVPRANLAAGRDRDRRRDDRGLAAAARHLHWLVRRQLLPVRSAVPCGGDHLADQRARAVDRRTRDAPVPPTDRHFHAGSRSARLHRRSGAAACRDHGRRRNVGAEHRQAVQCGNRLFDLAQMVAVRQRRHALFRGAAAALARRRAHGRQSERRVRSP